MSNSNNPPFAIGQKIIRVKKWNEFFKKDVTYTSAGCLRCPTCHHWFVLIKEYPNIDKADIITCSCGSRSKWKVKYYAGKADFFAPIQNQYNDITEQLASEMKQTDESPDIKNVPLTVK